jgi:hypothetical protein
MRKRLLLIASFLLPLFKASAATDVEFLLDLSGSMMKRIDGVPQIDLARKAFRDALTAIPADELVAVRVFAHRIEQTNKSESCQDTELIYPFAKIDRELVGKTLEALQPKGYTPLAYSLEKSGEDLKQIGKEREPERVIVVLSDGEETCGGDSIAVLQKLKDQGIKVVVHTIGFNVDDTARKQLQEISNFTGGRYFDAKDGEKLSESLKLATKEAFVAPPALTATNAPALTIEKPRELFYGKEVRGGNGYSTASQLVDLGTQLKLDHHQVGDDKDYFYLDLTAGDLVHGILRTGDKALTNGRELEGYAGGRIEIHGPEKTEADGSFLEILSNSPNTKEENDFFVSQSGRYYFLVGAYGQDVHKDHLFFTLSVSRKGDIDTEMDAGSTHETALPIVPGVYQKNFGGLGDNEDRFKLTAKKSEKYVFTMAPQSETGPRCSISIVDSLKISVDHESRGGGKGEGLEARFTVPEDGDYFLIVKYSNNREYSDYTVKLTKSE